METCKLRGIMEDYKKKYEDALERAKVINPGTADYEVAVKIFPELKGNKEESKDDKIRKALINIFSTHQPYEVIFGASVEDILAWLEKQGEHTSADNKPKFKVGDFIVSDYCMGKVIELTNDAYLLDSGQGIPFSCEHNTHLWTIQDAKDGDVLAFKDGTSGILLYKESTENFGVLSYCRIIGNSFINKQESGWGSTLLSPATKEQRDLLFRKLKEAGYDWDAEKYALDAEKKELEKVDTYCQENCKGFQETGRCFCDGECKAKKEHIKQNLQDNDFLRIEQKSAEWSEDDENNLNTVLKIIRDSDTSAQLANRLTFWLKSLRPQKQWKSVDKDIYIKEQERRNNMTREEQITFKAGSIADGSIAHNAPWEDYYQGFIEGAKWADANPSQPSLPSNLEEAAENYYEYDCPYDGEARVVNREHDVWFPSQAIEDAFKAGAEWMAKQLKQE